MNEVKIKVRNEWAGMAVDHVIVAADIGLSRRKIRRILDMGGITVNQRKVRVASQKVQAGELICLSYTPESLKVWSQQQFSLTSSDVLFARHKIVAINKPPLLPSQPPRSKDAAHAASVLKQFYEKSRGKSPDFFLCHRLDKETSGILLLAEDEATTNWVMGQFKAKTVSKVYLAMSYGIPAQSSWKVEAHLSAIDKKSGMVSFTHAGGRFSRTHFRVIEVNRQHKLSLIACYPETGRSHQIRVHLAHSQLPIVGDKKYAGPAPKNLGAALRKLTLTHHFLHAARLMFRSSPDEARPVRVEAKLPVEFAAFIKEAGFKQLDLHTLPERPQV